MKEILLGREELLQTFASSFHDETVRLRRERNQQTEASQKELIKVQRSIDRCLDFITGGDGAMDTVRKTLAQLEISKETILASLEQLAPPVKVDNHPNIGHLYQRRIEQIVKLFSDEDTQQEAVTIIRSLIDRIDITPGESRGKPKVELIGGLAAILQLTISGHKKTAIQEDSGICRVLMVAGAGFEPATFRL